MAADAAQSKVPQIPPGPLEGAAKLEEATLEDVPDSDALGAWLNRRGVDTSRWGEGGTKPVGKFWKELKLREAGLEVWRKADGTLQPVRVTHVLRAKVCSAKSYERGIFLFNTWQQFADGRRRTRNALLSEKLSVAETPIEEHLDEVCRRAITEEEMQVVVEAAFALTPGEDPPEFDPDRECPIRVERNMLIDYAIEVENSKSFPGLLTMYHLYTVDIVCSGLPGVDFGTLEFDEPDKDGDRQLKYLHAWSWLDWSTIQRYLFEGSKLKETRKKGSFADEAEIGRWLGKHGVDLSAWAEDGCRSVGALLEELEKEQAQLELWGRHDGVPILMRVVHVLQLQVVSRDPRLQGKFLFNTWQQTEDGRCRTVNRLMSRKLSTERLPFTGDRFNQAVEEAVDAQLSYLMDVHYKMHPPCVPQVSQHRRSLVVPTALRFKDHHFDIEESTTFEGLRTMYHMYSMEVECDGLPLADFTSLDFSRGAARVNSWCWVTWPEILDMLHARTRVLQRLLPAEARVERRRAWSGCGGTMAKLLPPSMVSKMAEATIASSEFLAEVQLAKVTSKSLVPSMPSLNSRTDFQGSPLVTPMPSELPLSSELWQSNPSKQLREWDFEMPAPAPRSRSRLLTVLGLSVCSLQIAAGLGLLRQASSRRGQLSSGVVVLGALGMALTLAMDAKSSDPRDGREEDAPRRPGPG